MATSGRQQQQLLWYMHSSSSFCHCDVRNGPFSPAVPDISTGNQKESNFLFSGGFGKDQSHSTNSIYQPSPAQTLHVTVCPRENISLTSKNAYCITYSVVFFFVITVKSLRYTLRQYV